MEKLFEEITGLKPYPFQLKIAEKILESEENLVITAPTGAGKTWLSCMPFFYAKLNNIEFADRMIYVLPQRTLVTAVANTLTPYLQKHGIKVTVQMGSQPDDPYFEGDIVVTTIDQVLSSYIGISYGSSRNLSNIAPGAFLGAYIVVDEFHLLEIDKALATFIDLSRRINPFTKILMMTATAPESLVRQVSNLIGGSCEIISSSQIVSLQQKENVVRKRIIKWNDSPISAESIIKQHLNKTLVVVNTVGKAQLLFKQLKTHIDKLQLDIEVLCIHARFLPEDRKEKETKINEVFKRGSEREMIVIANQVVEVGLDISATVLISELCPANALIQRIGRCSRYGETVGKVFVHNVEKSYLPYKKETMERTKDYLTIKSEFEMTATEEAQMVEDIHLDDDQKTLNQVPLTTVRKFVNRSLMLGEAQYIRDLIRDIRNIGIIIHPNPSEIDLNKKPERFSVPISSILSCLSKLKAGATLQEVVYYPEFPEEWEKGQQPNWKPIQRQEDIFYHTLLVISPNIVSYSSEMGLVLNEEGTYISKEASNKDSGFKLFSYKKESYLEHVNDVRKLIRKGDRNYRNATNKLSVNLNVGSNIFNEWSECLGALHDIGKLTTKYVDVLNRWQKEVCNDDSTDYLAHNEFNPYNPLHKEFERNYKRQSHAPEGGVISLPLLDQMVEKTITENELLSSIVNAILFSIIRHHGAYVKNIQAYQLVPDAEEVVGESLKGIDTGEIILNHEISISDANDFNNKISLSVSNDIELVLYWYFSRRLRLADQLSQKLKSEQ